MRIAQLASLAVLAALATFSPSSSFPMAEVISVEVSTTGAFDAKIEATLLSAVREDADVEADVMVQLESPEEAMHRVCGDDQLSRADKTTCMVDNMQKFADDSQQDVKDLLVQHEGEYADAKFFWINNSVSVKKAKGSLVLALSALDTVREIHSEKIFHTMTGSRKQRNGEAKPKTIGLSFVH